MHFDKIEQHTNDLPAAKAFYKQLLGFAIANQSATNVSFKVGSSLLSFVETKEAAFYHIAFLIPSNQLDQAFQFINAKTPVLPFTCNSFIANFKKWNAQAFYFHDYSGNILEFIAHHDLHLHSDVPFSATTVLQICELGLPVSSVTATCHYLNEHYQLPYYVKGPRLEDFAVMGDDEGLLIVTTTGRGWLPTQRPAEQHSFNIQITHNNKTIQLHQSDLLK